VFAASGPRAQAPGAPRGVPLAAVAPRAVCPWGVRASGKRPGWRLCWQEGQRLRAPAQGGQAACSGCPHWGCSWGCCWGCPSGCHGSNRWVCSGGKCWGCNGGKCWDCTFSCSCGCVWGLHRGCNLGSHWCIDSDSDCYWGWYTESLLRLVVGLPQEHLRGLLLGLPLGLLQWFRMGLLQWLLMGFQLGLLLGLPFKTAARAGSAGCYWGCYSGCCQGWCWACHWDCVFAGATEPPVSAATGAALRSAPGSAARAATGAAAGAATGAGLWGGFWCCNWGCDWGCYWRCDCGESYSCGWCSLRGSRGGTLGGNEASYHREGAGVAGVGGTLVSRKGETWELLARGQGAPWPRVHPAGTRTDVQGPAAGGQAGADTGAWGQPFPDPGAGMVGAGAALAALAAMNTSMSTATSLPEMLRRAAEAAPGAQRPPPEAQSHRLQLPAAPPSSAAVAPVSHPPVPTYGNTQPNGLPTSGSSSPTRLLPGPKGWGGHAPVCSWERREVHRGSSGGCIQRNRELLTLVHQVTKRIVLESSGGRATPFVDQVAERLDGGQWGEHIVLECCR